MWNNSLPLYRQIANKIKEDIIGSKLAKGDAIPAEAKLAKTYEVSRVTVRQAIKLLVEEGLLYSIQGSGTYVAHNKVEHNILHLQGFTEEMQKLQNNPKNEVLEFKLTDPTDEVQEILNISSNEKVYYMKRLRYADHEPFLLEESFLPVDLFPDFSIEVIKKSKYNYIENKGYTIDKRYGELIPILPNEELKKILQLQDNQPLLFLKAFTVFEDGKPFEYSKVYYHPKKYSFKFISEKND
ncbi:GntR family transcriptional regulator [Virgibacillus chiguensis]|uniref:GntR family transcriptional regulator, mannosyl-D-glycerate transport/metabolism system repressor n=1 Tax=Virgibacillus chiguensis TaxID=411959 RepID=A0A1M5QPF4_9BACI|nr:GntR family transcriptional regulator [Virgibacillus chiguensis]SHH15985.1 GntR family transcriptional regulator, mannosyl-D-glycerate transport/metabolism system repressor [Virgibacillus chiguensis]